MNKTVPPSPSAAGRKDTLTSIVLVMVAALCFAAGHAGGKFLTSDLHPFVISFWRNFFSFVPFLPWLIRNGPSGMRTNRFGFQLIRSVFIAATLILWFSALDLMPLADATALSMVGPLFAIVFAGIFLGERFEAHRWWAVGFGLVGALVIVRPGFEAVGLGAILVILRGLSQAVSKVMTKSLTRTDDGMAIVIWGLLLMLPITLGLALWVWKWPSLSGFAILIAMGGVAALANVCMIRAYTMIDVGLVEPITFTRLIWAALLGYLVFADFPDPWVWVGGIMIAAATTYIARRESRKHKSTD
jgi:drug/metabolite transporter (DMT)-like permease